MINEVDPSARMQVRSQGELVAPGTCIVCGTGSCDDGYLDLGVFIDYVGTAYLCKTCCYQAGETFGLFTPEEVQETLKLANDLNAKVEELTQELDNARKHVDAANALLYSKFGPVSVDVGSLDEGSTTVLTVVNEPAANADAGEPVLTEPTPLKRRRNVTGSEPRNPTL